jgi:hypothetical protein
LRTGEGLLPLVNLVRDFASAVALQRDSATDLAPWFDVLATNDAIEQSLRTRKAVEVGGGPAHE